MIINQGNLAALSTGYKAQFKNGFDGVKPSWDKVATLVPSTTKSEAYAWLGQFPRLREWVGDRLVKSLEAHAYTITNKKYESTISVPMEDIEDDTYGVYSPLLAEMGRAAASHPDELVFGLLKDGFTQLCFDGQYFFDIDHPVGKGVVSNMQPGAGEAWFLLDISRALKPLIFQKRKDYQMVVMNQSTDEVVFSRGEMRYGVEARANVGYGFWQMAFGSRAALNKANYADARQRMQGLKSDEGRPLGITPELLVVPPSLEGQALEILNAERDAAGATNVYKGTAQLLVCPYLA